jgi:glycyl-tRNA synthetase
MPESTNFQDIIINLQNFWARRGCLIWQPYYSQVGAGTYNPATFLRVLGPEPWNVAYVEPSIRPDDARYGENPNRLQQHYQYQVILKPDPGNPQEVYLQSLEAIGIDPRRHDIRFVEDNWQSPALGAWGLGWEVWLDGQEITQFTYFQQSGGQVLDPPSVEITYGLERIAMPLQRVRNFRDIRWTESRTYGDVNLQGEQEHSKYYFEIADIERNQELYKIYMAEAESALEKGLVLPAYDQILKCSQTFNVLDTRGAVGVTERQVMFGKMRDLSRRVSEAYIEERKALGFPWLAQTEPLKAEAAPKAFPAAKPSQKTVDFLLEIGTEELPVFDLDAALTQLRERVPALLDDLRLEHGNISVMGTPRRLVVMVEKIASRQEDRTLVVKGPPAARAFDPQGKPTPAAEGFARGKGIPVEKLEVREMEDGSYVTAVIQENGISAAEVLQKALPELIGGIKFEKSIRWNSSNVVFSRPTRWLLALAGGQVIPFEFAGLTADGATRGLRLNTPAQIEVGSTIQYRKVLEAQGIILDPQARREAIEKQVKEVMRKAGGEPVLSDTILDEVTNLVEAPQAFLGKFNPDFLRLPAEVLISVMEKHQRYFTIRKADGSLLPNFVGVRNGDDQFLETVADGNEQVITARFNDADFFIKQDLQHKLEDFLPRLATLTFQVKLGSMLDKSRRIERLVNELAEPLGLEGKEKETALRAAMLCKADLVSKMVVEMTSLQGTMGRFYALNSGEEEAVADAIRDHYRPRFAGDASPSTKAALAISLADRFDSLAGLFGVGLAPSGTKDPYAQRRAAIGLVQALIDWDLDFDINRGLFMAATGLAMLAGDESLIGCRDFIIGRLQSILLEQGYRYDVVAAVLAEQGSSPARATRAVKELTEWVNRKDWQQILPAYARCVRITRDQNVDHTFNPKALEVPAEQDLYNSFEALKASFTTTGSPNNFLSAFKEQIPVINNFFDKVMVMSDDPIQRENRLYLLQQTAGLAAGTADFSKLEGF